MIQYQMQAHGDMEQNLWQHGRGMDLGEFFKLGVAHNWERNNIVSIAQEESRIHDAEEAAGTRDMLFEVDTDNELAEQFGTDKHKHAMSEDEWKKSEWYRARADGKPAFEFRADMTPQRAQIFAEIFDRRQEEARLLDVNSQGFGRSAVLFGASFVASLADPINFIPMGSGFIRGASLGKKVLRGAYEGAAGALLADALVYPLANKRGEDFGFFDAALDITFGAAIGGGLGGLGGLMRNAHDARLDRLALDAEQEIAHALPEVGFTPDDAKLYAGQIVQTLRDMGNGARTVLEVRKRLGGIDRVNSGKVLEKAMLDIAAGRPVDVVPFIESLRLGEAFDQIGAEIVGKLSPRMRGKEVLLTLYPEGENPLHVQRGESTFDAKGNIKVRGAQLLEDKGTRSNFGLVKIRIHHPEIRKGEVMSVPRIIREFEPFIDGQGRRTWRVQGEDGLQLIIAEGKMKGGEGMLVTMYKRDRKGPLPYSQKKTPTDSRQIGFPPKTGDTAGGTVNPQTRSQQGVNAPDNAGAKNREGSAEKVKSVMDDTGYRAPDLPENMAEELKREGIDMSTGKSMDEAEAERLVSEGRYEVGEADELRHAINEAERVGVREEATLSVLGCIMGAL